MGYNKAIIKMKKILFLLVSLFCITMTVNAQDARGNCTLPGTYDYVNVDYYRDGHLAVSNQSGMVITQLHITVIAVETWDANGKQQERGAPQSYGRADFLRTGLYEQCCAERTGRHHCA